MAELIRLQDIHKVYHTAHGDVPVLRGITLSVEEGEYVTLTGPSGSGKSTLLSIIGCLDRATSGQYTYGGADVTGLDDDAESELRGSRIGFVFQAFHLIGSLTTLENVEVPLIYARVPRAERHDMAAAALARVGLTDRLRHYPKQLSGGEQQRVAIARSLVRDPDFIVADEPTGNLDSRTGERILRIFDQLHASGKTVLLVTHDPHLAGRLPREVRLLDGVISEDVVRQEAAS